MLLQRMLPVTSGNWATEMQMMCLRCYTKHIAEPGFDLASFLLPGIALPEEQTI